MARTISQIYNSMVLEKQTFSSLDDLVPNPDDSQTYLTNLTSPSKVAIWRLILWVCAFAIWTHESLWDVFKAEVIATGEALIPGVPVWYRDESLKFQNGDELVYNDTTKQFEYEVLDTDKQIIEQAAVVEVGAIVNIKVAKSDGATGLEKLTTSEKAAFTSYIEEIKFAGIQTNIISDDPDSMKISADVFVDNTVIYNDESNPSDPLNGSLISDSTTFPIENSITNYISTLDFNGKLFVTQLTDAIQSTTGVNNIVVTLVEAKYGALSYSDILTVSGQLYQSNAGYIEIDGSYPLSDTLTYINS